MTRWRLAVAALGLFGLGALAGRMTVPAKVVSVEKLKEVEAKATKDVAAAYDNAKAAKASTRSLAVDHSFLQDYHWTWHPDGTVEATATTTKKDTRQVASTETASTAHASASSSSHAATEYRYLDRVVEPPRPRWSIGAAASLGLDGRPRFHGADVGFRLFRGLSVTLGADVPDRTLLLGARVEF